MNLLEALNEKEAVLGDKIQFIQGDIFTIDEDGRLINPSGMPLVFNTNSFTKEAFEIIKPEPEILSAVDYCKKNHPTQQEDYVRDIYNGFEAGDLNGQRKDRKKTQPLIDAVSGILQLRERRDLKLSIVDVCDLCNDVFKNIKPLNP